MHTKQMTQQAWERYNKIIQFLIEIVCNIIKVPLEGVVGGSGHSWNRLSHYYGLYLDHCKLSSLLQSFRCGLHGQIKENFSGGVANYRYCQTNSPFLYTHCTTAWRKKTTITFRLFYFIMTNYSKDQDTQASHKTTKNCCCFPHLIGFFLH